MREALQPGRLRAIYNRLARHYDRQHALVTARADQRGREAVVRLAVRAGDHVLDAGGGTGSTALLAARAVGERGRVTVLDLSEGMLAVARDKAQAEGCLPRLRFVVGDALRLPFETGSFDAVLSTYSLCPLYDPAEGVRELYRVLKRGGRLAAAHSSEPANPLLRRLAGWVEGLAWKVPLLSMGCRPVETLPALRAAGAEVESVARIGVPLWPFIVYCVRKPD